MNEEKIAGPINHDAFINIQRVESKAFAVTDKSRASKINRSIERVVLPRTDTLLVALNLGFNQIAPPEPRD